MIYQTSYIGLILVLFASVGFNSTNATEILDYVENNIIRGMDDPPDYYCKNYYGDNESSARDLLLRSWCD